MIESLAEFRKVRTPFKTGELEERLGVRVKVPQNMIAKGSLPATAVLVLAGPQKGRESPYQAIVGTLKMRANQPCRRFLFFLTNLG
jgi:hypothetical protein